MEQTAMQKMIRQLKGAIQIIDEHGKLNDYAQTRKEVYQNILDIATELLPLERKRHAETFNAGIEYARDVVGSINSMSPDFDQYFDTKFSKQ